MRNLPASVAARASICAQSRDGRAQVGFRGVPEFDHQRVSFERLLHDAPLNPFAPSVNEPYLTETGVVGGVHVFFDNGLDLAGRKRMKVERVFYRDAMVLVNSQLPTSQLPSVQPVSRQPAADAWELGVGRWEFSYDAVTTVLIPPRTEKSPTTVIRRGWQAATRSSRMAFVTAS